MPQLRGNEPILGLNKFNNREHHAVGTKPPYLYSFSKICT
jgi:hypothetical protein